MSDPGELLNVMNSPFLYLLVIFIGNVTHFRTDAQFTLQAYCSIQIFQLLFRCLCLSLFSFFLRKST